MFFPDRSRVSWGQGGFLPICTSGNLFRLFSLKSLGGANVIKLFLIVHFLCNANQQRSKKAKGGEKTHRRGSVAIGAVKKTAKGLQF